MKRRIMSELIRKSLNRVFARLAQNATAKEKTKAVKTALCVAGNSKGLFTCAKDVEKDKRNHGEWLYDVCWLQYGDPKFVYLKEAVLIAECQWWGKYSEKRNLDEIRDDFQKLLVGRARCRCMIWDDNREQDESTSVDCLIRMIRTCSATAPDDFYLLARYTAGGFQYWHVTGKGRKTRLRTP